MDMERRALAHALKDLANDAPRLHVPHTPPAAPFQPLRAQPKRREGAIMGDATAQELHLARVTRQQAMEALENAAALGLELHVPDQLRQQQERIRQREQQEALALQEEARPAVPPPPLPPPPPPPQILTAVPPSIEDLFSLWRLCGGSEAHVVETLARLWGTAPGDIAETVRTWLAPMPPIKLPSRSHSAPPVLPLEVRERLKSAGPSAFPAIRQPWERRAAVRRAARQYDDQGAPVNPLALNSLAAARGLRGGPTRASTAARAPPAQSAPVAHSQRMVDLASDLSSALSGLHSATTRLHGAAKPTGPGQRRATADRDVYTLPDAGPAFRPVVLTAAQVATVPEDYELLLGVHRHGQQGEDDALEAFMARNAASLKLNVRDVAKPSDFGSHRMRF